MKKACKHCKHWEEPNCVRFPPWERTEWNHWCNEFKRLPEKKIEEKESRESYLQSETRKAVNLYEDRFQQIMSRRPYINAADRAAAGRLAKAYDRDTLDKIFYQFLADPPQWNKDNNRYDLRFIPGVVNLILARMRNEGL